MTRAETNSILAPGARLEVCIEKLVHGGLGLARHQGQVLLVGYALPGERVRVELRQRRSGFWQAGLVEVLEPASGRLTPPCPYYGRCGGCRLQHAEYALQLEIKRAILLETLRRIGRIEPPSAPEIVAGPCWEYRNRVQLHLRGRRLGFFEASSQRICVVEQCMIASPRINQVLLAVQELAAAGDLPPMPSTVEIFTDGERVQVGLDLPPGTRIRSDVLLARLSNRAPGVSSEPLEYAAACEKFRVGRRSFFQVNRFLIAELLEHALRGAAGRRALDLYAGVGLFTLPMARRFAQVTAVESSGPAAEDLAFNTQRAGLPVEVRRADAAAFLASLTDAPDFVLADPPRAGLGPNVVRELLRLKPPGIRLVGCDPATLARDLALLVAGGYRLEHLTLLDLFPQTHHLEVVAALGL
ncbi:MAG: class I SAM-dependent RNA methyltransferase [Bryobacteraceae bacterium]|nr:class I SAM-dependent RNA methyltransferase [Bryobacteraceae bacterium]